MPSQLNFNPLRAVDANGDPVPGALATFFETGTSTPLTVYTDDGLGTPHPSPLVADAQGVFAPVFTDGATAVKVDVTTAALVTLNGYPIDPVQLIASTGSAASAVSFAPITGNAATNVQAAIAILTALWNAVTTYGKSLMAAADAGTARTTLGIITATNLAEGLVELATTAEGTTGTATNRVPAVDVVKSMIGTHASTPTKAWVIFNGNATPAVIGNLGVSSITDNGTGDYTINFSPALSTADYAVIGSCSGFGAGGTNNRAIFQVTTDASVPLAKTTTALRINTTNTTGSYVDCFQVYVQILA